MAFATGRNATFRTFARRLFWLKEVILPQPVPITGSGSETIGGGAVAGIGIGNLDELFNIRVKIKTRNIKVFNGFSNNQYNGLYVYKSEGKNGEGWYKDAYNTNDEYFAIILNQKRFKHILYDSVIFETKRNNYNDKFDIYDLEEEDWVYIGNRSLKVEYEIE